MNTSVGTWLLAGALAASLAWHAKPWIRATAADSNTASNTACESGPDFDGLDLSPDQTLALKHWRETSCETGCRTENEADVKLQQLHAALRNPSASAESLRQLAGQVNQLRARSLDECVGSILEVRRVLSKEQLEKLMQCCESRGCSNP